MAGAAEGAGEQTFVCFQVIRSVERQETARVEVPDSPWAHVPTLFLTFARTRHQAPLQVSDMMLPSRSTNVLILFQWRHGESIRSLDDSSCPVDPALHLDLNMLDFNNYLSPVLSTESLV